MYIEAEYVFSSEATEKMDNHHDLNKTIFQQ